MPVRVPRYKIIHDTAQGLAVWKWLGTEYDAILPRYDADFERGLKLVAAGTTPEGPAWGSTLETMPGTTLPILLAWQGTMPLDRRITFSLHVIDPTGKLVAQVDREMAGGQFPTTLWHTWQSEPTIAGEFPLDLPSDLMPGHYRLLAGAFETETGAALSRPDGSQWVVLAEIEVKP